MAARQRCERFPRKVVYTSERKAIEAMEMLDRRQGLHPNLRVFRCGRHFHLGHHQSASAFERKIKKKMRQQ
jgi:hypothetical protein